MPDVDAEIPQRIEQALGQRPDEWVVGVVAQEHDIHVAIEPESRTAVPTDRDEGHAPTGLATERTRRGVRCAVERAQQPIECACVRARRADARVATAYGILERPAVSAEVSTAGLAERRCETTQIDDRAGSIRQRSASMTVTHEPGNLLAYRA
jgi:hypothetical protein